MILLIKKKEKEGVSLLLLFNVLTKPYTARLYMIQ